MEPHDIDASSSLTELFEQHSELALALQDVDRTLKRHDRSRQQVDERLWKLAELVESHFDHEECGGYMAEALARAPRLTPTAEKLLAEHSILLDDAKKLQILARSGVESDAWWRQIDSDFRHLKSRLLAHEHAENKLLHEAFSRDIGASD